MKVCPTCQNQFADETDYCPADGAKLRRKHEKALDTMIGRVLEDRWVVEKKLGEGGMGAVYLAHQRSMSRAVAVKTLRKELVDSDEFVDRFMREVQVATALSHPHIVTVLDFGQDTDGTLFLVMELLEGEELTTRLARRSMTAEEALLIAIQIASALEAAHAMSIVHRDLKPDNVFMLKMAGGGTFAKVLDFGIAKVLDSESKVTKTGMIFGTPEYMSPEQCKGVGVDHRSDFYALGCMLFEMLGGRTPFKADTPMALLLAHVSTAAPRPSSFGVSIDPNVEEFVMRLLSKEADDRPASATIVREILQKLLSNLEPAPASEVSAFSQTRAFETVAMEQSPKGKKAVWVAVAGVLAIGAAVGSVVLFANNADVEPSPEVPIAQVPVVVEEAIEPLPSLPELAAALDSGTDADSEPPVAEPAKTVRSVKTTTKARSKEPDQKPAAQPKEKTVAKSTPPEPAPTPVVVEKTKEPPPADPTSNLGKVLKRKGDKLKNDVSKEAAKAKSDAAKVFESQVEGFFD